MILIKIVQLFDSLGDAIWSTLYVIINMNAVYIMLEIYM